MSSWYDSARDLIRLLDRTLDPDLPFEERRKAVSEAYPWGERRMLPYKMWLKAQKEYLTRYQKSDASVPENHLSPMERMMKRAAQ